MSNAGNPNARGSDEEGSDEEEQGQHAVQKRKADTDCVNKEFEMYLSTRNQAPPRNFKHGNVQRVRSMCSGRPLVERLNIPEGVDVFGYGNQKLNIWEYQKEQLRQQIAKDPSKFYTYSAEHLSLAFPIVNENEIPLKEKAENERRWKTKNGFDNVMKRLNWNEHQKKPDQATIDNLKLPYHIQALETKKQMKGFQMVLDDKEDFQCNIKSRQKYFSDNSYFNTVFISGDDMVKEMQAQKQKEIDDFNKKVVVANPHFIVNTMEKRKVAQVDKFSNIRDGEVQKIGLRFSKKRLQDMAERQILSTQTV